MISKPMKIRELHYPMIQVCILARVELIQVKVTAIISNESISWSACEPKTLFCILLAFKTKTWKILTHPPGRSAQCDD